LQNRTGYASKFSDDQLKKQLVARPTTYLLGEIDILPLGGFDSDSTAESFGIAPDGTRMAIAAREQLSSLMMAERVPAVVSSTKR